MINLIYTRIRNVLLATLQATPEWPTLDPCETDMLHRLSDVWAKGDDITVLQAAGIVPDCSLGTALTRLNVLKTKGVVTMEPSITDRRVKLVKPTRLTLDLFDRLGNNYSKLIGT
jgi:hypothetical protein